MHRTWPGANGKRDFPKEQGNRQAHFPTHLLAGSMVCGCYGATIAQVCGKSGGYYGCLAATKGACDNKTLVRRSSPRRSSSKPSTSRSRILSTSPMSCATSRRRFATQRADLPDTLTLKEAELAAEQRRLANFVDFTGEGRGSQALAKALVEIERESAQNRRLTAETAVLLPTTKTARKSK